MLEVCRNQNNLNLSNEKKQPREIIITRYEEKVQITDGGNTKTIKRIPVKVNITRMVNESAKVIKNNTAMEKLKELENALSKEINK